MVCVALKFKVKQSRYCITKKEDNEHQFNSFFDECIPSTSGCGITKSHKHCTLCEKTFNTPYHCKRHFFQSHASRAVQHEGSYCYPCKRAHSLQLSRAHYHCPLCETTIVNKEPFLKHLRAHSKKNIPENAETSPDDDKEDINKMEASPQIGEQNDDNPDYDSKNDEGPKTARKTIPQTAECPICSTRMHKKSIRRHCREQHEAELSGATCVDEQEGLFLVRNSSKGGVSYPIHVQKLIGGLKTSVACEVDQCMDTMGVAWRSGIKSAECHHLLNVGKNPVFPENIILDKNVLEDLSKNGMHKLLSDDRIDSCKRLFDFAEEKKKPCVVPMKDGERYAHFSVFHGEVNYFSRFGRVVLTADLSKGTLDCRCCRRKVPCTHKGIVLWYLHQIDSLQAFQIGTTTNEDDAKIPKDLGVHGEKPVYPPTDPKIIEKMCAYLHAEKRTTTDLSHIDTPLNVTVMKFIPTETQCFFCKSPLSSVIRITNRAKLLTMRGVFEGLETYCKRCPNCDMCYRYQETVHNIHNFNDNFLIGLDVCKFLRESLQQHLPIGSIVNVLKNQFNKAIISQTVVDAYMHFESLSSHDYNYSCALCGYHPTTLIMDLNQKVAFDCPQLELPEVYDPDKADVVNCDEFWRRVEMSMVLRGFPDRKVPDFQVTPNLLFWSPYIGKNTRKDKCLFNTEHRKVKRNSGELEADCREITEERLLEILNNCTGKEIKAFSKSIGCRPAGSKFDMIINIRNAISKSDDKFKKAFSKYWGRSGGWVSATCPHGIIYALKFVLRAESPRDYIDILESMEHQPNVVVCDMANMLVAHGNKRRVDMFQPYNGMVVEPTDENVTLASEGNLSVSFPWLRDNHVASGDAAGTHPVSGSDHHLCLFDRFHEKNTKKEVEVLRRITNVLELRGHLNSQRDEQLHSSFNHDRRFINQMTPVNHIFLFRCNIEVRNEKKNALLLEKLATSYKYEVTYDINGRAFIDKTQPLPLPKRPKRTIKSSHQGENRKKAKHSPLPSDRDDSPIDDMDTNVMDGSASTPVPSTEETNVWGEDEEDEMQHTPSSPITMSSTHGSFSEEAKTFSEKETDTPTAPSPISVGSEREVLSEEEIEQQSTAHSPISVVSMNSTNDFSESDLDAYWVKELGLKIRDKNCILGGYWLNDRIINAAMKLMKKENPSIIGLVDVILAAKYGFKDRNSGKFVQILNVRGNHWLTLSNTRCIGPVVEIYDSLHSLNYKTNSRAISYPIVVEQAACSLSQPRRRVIFRVLDVQQQLGGADCGLFAIAFAQILCSGGHPSEYVYMQGKMRKELARCLEEQNIKEYVSSVAVYSKDERTVLYEFFCKVHCYCRMPDDGKLMVMCSICKTWFHKECVDNDHTSSGWACRRCHKRDPKQIEQDELEALFTKFKQASFNANQETSKAQELYRSIASIASELDLPDAKDHIACLNIDVYNEIVAKDFKKKYTDCLGCTHANNKTFFIVIFHEHIKSERGLLGTLIHELGHALDKRQGNRDSAPHGKSFRKITKSLLKMVMKNKDKLASPYNSFDLQPHEVVNAKVAELI